MKVIGQLDDGKKLVEMTGDEFERLSRCSLLLPSLQQKLEDAIHVIGLTAKPAPSAPDRKPKVKRGSQLYKIAGVGGTWQASYYVGLPDRRHEWSGPTGIITPDGMTGDEFERLSRCSLLLPSLQQKLEDAIHVIGLTAKPAPSAPDRKPKVKRGSQRRAVVKMCRECGKQEGAVEFYRGQSRCKACHNAYTYAQKKRRMAKKSAGAASADDPALTGGEAPYKRRPHPGGPDAFEGMGVPFVKGRRSKVGS